MLSRAVQVTYAVLFGAATLVAFTGDKGAATEAARVERGRYLVTSYGCTDCHTPKTFGPDGPQEDVKRMLSGHPHDVELPPAPTLPAGPWAFTGNDQMTAWSGPWGTSFTANLTPDVETGLGSWKEEDFVATIKTGRHMGRGRPLLPPMPAPALANLDDEDLKSIFAFLRTLPAVKNAVPEPRPPADAR
ncbi:MAG TPA: diheme cytochrome c-553 [Planctomycetota bacterium]|nr:diheme cytochrome c-553 [Planctomycetota bacterium]